MSSKCPNYVDYSQVSHTPFSSGPLKFPSMRPKPQCRTFVSPAVDTVIEDLVTKINDPDLARLVENCLPNTLDTTILWHDLDPQSPLAFVVTGDIHAEWLRDSARQLSVYQPFVKYDSELQTLMKGAINLQAKYILDAPYCNAFHPPPQSKVSKGDSAKDSVYPRPDWKQVFECKYELDSLASFLTLSNEYYVNSGDDSFVTKDWIQAFTRILAVLQRESRSTFHHKSGQVLNYPYSFQRWTNIGLETLPLAGTGNPVNYGTGLVRSAFRPSDDTNIFQFFIPANIHMVTELKRARDNYLVTGAKTFVDDESDALIEITDTFITNIEKGIQEHGIVTHPEFGKVYAFEVDGYGSNLLMDDANIPSLLSIPDMGFVDKSNDVYQNTRRMILSKLGNPYYLTGRFFEGIGGPHIGIHNAWPMSLLMRIRTSDDDEEIMHNLDLVMKNTAGLGLMHESVHVNSKGGYMFTRSWFAWCNSEFGKTIMYLAKHKPHLIFKPEYNKSYSIEEVLKARDI